MKTKNILLATITFIVGFSFAATSTYAGSKQQHRWEGVAIGVGAAVVGGAIVNSYTRGYHGAPPVSVSLNYAEYDRSRGHHRDHYRPHKPYRCCKQRYPRQCRKNLYRHQKHRHHDCRRSLKHDRH